MLVIPDGVGVRNFVLGSFLPRLSEVFRVDIVHAIPDAILPQYLGTAPPERGMFSDPLRSIFRSQTLNRVWARPIAGR